MKYNVSPFVNAMLPNNANYDVWVKRFNKFFANENCDPTIHDEWYNHLLENIDEVKRLLQLGYLVDEYSGIATFDDSKVGQKVSFSMAYYIQRNYTKFIRKKALTVVGDYGITNLQLQMCGIKVVSSFMDNHLIPGAILTAIMNECVPYPINHYQFPTHDMLLACSVFDEQERAEHNWDKLLDQYAFGKEVYFTSNTFCYLKKFVNYDIIQALESPMDVYEVKDFENLQYGYTNKVYQINADTQVVSDNTSA